MSEFTKRPHATFSPTKCALCGAHEGPFIDTHIEWPGFGHVWICLANDKRIGCVRQLARHEELYTREEMETLHERILELKAENEVLKGTEENELVSETVRAAVREELERYLKEAAGASEIRKAT